MYEDTEETSDNDEDFFNALTLLHSSADDSAEKLRRMLDASIERRYGFERTLAARMPERFLRGAQKCRGRTATGEKAETEKRWSTRKNGSASPTACGNNDAATTTSEAERKPIETIDVDMDDYSDDGDIPRISIPDEGSGDGLLCKVCNGAKLGPLILLECQDCQEVYHPLCHQPPVVDIDVYDPRIVWRCKKCTDTAAIDCVAEMVEEKKGKRYRSTSDSTKNKEAAAIGKTDVPKFPAKKPNGSQSKNKTNPADQMSSSKYLAYKLLKRKRAS